MVSFNIIFTSATILVAAAVNALPTGDTNNIRRQDEDGTVCGTEPVPGIKSPVNGSTITYTAAEQNDYDGHTFEVIYCSGQYFKTASLYVDTWLGGSGPSSDGTYAEALALNTKPDDGAASAGFYGYRYNVTVYPENGDYDLGLKYLTVYEVETGRCLISVADGAGTDWHRLLQCQQRGNALCANQLHRGAHIVSCQFMVSGL